jgi:hypothetical protein
MSYRFFGVREALIVLLLATAPTLAMAYIDPGNGAYMVQALFTLVGAALFYIRHPIRSAKLVWNRLLRRDNRESAPHSTSEAIPPAARETQGELPAEVSQELSDP